MNKTLLCKKLLNLNGRLNSAVIILIIAVVLAGCGDAFSPPAKYANEVSEGGGGGGADPVVPGSGGRKVSEIEAENPNFAKYNDKPGEPGMRIAALTQSESIGDDVTKQDTLGLWGDNKFHIEGYGSSFNGTFANAGFTDAMILYYNKLMPGEFKISARIRIKRAGGVSTGKGINIGAYANYVIDASKNERPEDNIVNGIPQWKAGQGSKGMGLFFRAESLPQFRIYYSSHPDNSTTAGTDAVVTPELKDIKLTKEYIYEVARVKIDPNLPEDAVIEYIDEWKSGAAIKKTSKNLMYTYKLLDSKTNLPVVNKPPIGSTTNYPVQLPPGVVNYFPYVRDDGSYTALEIASNTINKTTGIPVDGNRHPVGNTTIEMSKSLRGPVYPGISITGSVVEISQIKIWTSEAHGGNGMAWNYITGTGNDPIFQTPNTIPAYVPANKFDVRLDPNRASDDPVTFVVRDGLTVFVYSQADTPAQWQGLKNNGYRIYLTTVVDPYYADENIHYQLFPIGTPDAAFLDDAGKVTIEGDESQKQEVNGEKAYKKWSVKFNKEKITPGGTAGARFVLIARNLLLDDDKNAPDYSLLQSLPEYHFRIEVTRPPAGSSWD